MKQKKKPEKVHAKDLWSVLFAQPFPYLHELAPAERDRFVLLDAYLRDCLEEWCASGGLLSARSIVLLDDCAQSITRRFRLLDGEGQDYFGQFRRLARLHAYYQVFNLNCSGPPYKE